MFCLNVITYGYELYEKIYLLFEYIELNYMDIVVIFIRREITKHFTTSIYIVFGKKKLLYVHKKYNMLLIVGGHIDRDELPFSAAVREALEKYGLDVEIYNSQRYNDFSNGENFNNEKYINLGEFCNLHYINKFY